MVASPRMQAALQDIILVRIRVCLVTQALLLQRTLDVIVTDTAHHLAVLQVRLGKNTIIAML
jgi:hypothetical protein